MRWGDEEQRKALRQQMRRLNKPPGLDIPHADRRAHKARPLTERWQSGRSRRTRNAEYGQPYRGFESLPLRHFMTSSHWKFKLFKNSLPPKYPPPALTLGVLQAPGSRGLRASLGRAVGSAIRTSYADRVSVDAGLELSLKADQSGQPP